MHTIRDPRDREIEACELKVLSTVRDELTAHPSGILLKGGQIVLPQVLQDPAISIAYEGPSGDESYKIIPEIQGLVSRNK